MRPIAALAAVLALTTSTPAAQQHFRFRIDPLLDMHYAVRAALERNEPAPDEFLRHPLELAQRVEDSLQGTSWVAVDAAIVELGTGPESLERLRAQAALDDALQGPVSRAAIAYVRGLAEVLPAFDSSIWPRRKQALLATAARVEAMLDKPGLVETYAAGMALPTPDVPVPVVLVTDTVWPGASTKYGQLGPFCIIEPDTTDLLTAETVLHELAHAFDRRGVDSIPNQIRAALAPRGARLRPADRRVLRQAWHTLFFIHAGETIRREVDPDHTHYGDGESTLYARSEPVASIEREIWVRYLDGEIHRDTALEQIIDAIHPLMTADDGGG